MYLAAERTFLAWIRTGVSMMGFGFVVARFGLFLREIRAVEHIGHSVLPGGVSVWFGTALVFLGAAVNIIDVIHHVRLIRKLNLGDLQANEPSALGIFVALTIALIGLAMAIYLLVIR